MNDAIMVASASELAEELPSWLDRGLYPFAPRSFATPAGTMRYVDVGRGRPVVISHGTPSWSFEWREVIARLAESHRVIVPDHLGFGLSDKPADVSVLTPRAHAERLASLVRSLDVSGAILVGHDFGGPIGVAALLSERQRYSALVLSNTWLWSLAERADVRRLSRLVASPIGKLLYLGLNASPRWIVPAAFGDKSRLTPAVHRHYTAPFPRWSARLAPWKLGVELHGSAEFYEESWARRNELAALPARIVWGEADPTFGAAELERLASALPEATIERLPGVGHFTAEEAAPALVAAVQSLSRGG
ncbi:MAG: alpha/beta fold hydrolase [Myxococcales bacterium]|nr:alpha/beta fold hydrolase [Myxococcales bacterium]